MIVQALGGADGQVQLGQAVSLRCPACRQMGTFDRIGAHDVQTIHGPKSYTTGPRLCPNLQCRALIFFVWDGISNRLAASYPPERLDFDASNVPVPITKALAEAITCHANECYIAGAIMVRKTLEELCHDRQATGENLKERLRNLGGKIVLPQELLDGLDDLRLLGNDAAHVESQEFNTIGKDEVEVGIEFAKEVLKAVFQYADLLAKLRGLKRVQP